MSITVNFVSASELLAFLHYSGEWSIAEGSRERDGEGFLAGVLIEKGR